MESRWEGPFRENLRKIYRAIQSTMGSSLIVDGSKLPLYGYVLTMPAIDLYVVHLVRDLRAGAYSWLRKKPRPIMSVRLAHMPQHGPVRSSLEWDMCNAAAPVQKPFRALVRLRSPAGPLLRGEGLPAAGHPDVAFDRREAHPEEVGGV